MHIFNGYVVFYTNDQVLWIQNTREILIYKAIDSVQIKR